MSKKDTRFTWKAGDVTVAPVAHARTPTEEVPMSKKTKTPKTPAPTAKSEEKPKVLHWTLGLFESVAHDGRKVVVYCRKDGSPSPYLAKKVKGKKALFHATYTGMSYAEARKRLVKDAGGKAAK